MSKVYLKTALIPQNITEAAISQICSFIFFFRVNRGLTQTLCSSVYWKSFF